MRTSQRVSILLSILAALFILFQGSLAASAGEASSPKKVLIVVTSHGDLGNTGRKTGYYLSELSHPFFVLLDKGFTVDIASPKGGEAPMDPKSKNLNDPENKRFLDDASLVTRIQNTIPLNTIKPGDYAAIIFAGGHGPMWDLADDQVSEKLVRSIYDNGGVVAAVCHGPAALVSIKLANSKYLVDGKHLTAFSNAEEDAVGLTAAMPFALETKLKEHGAKYEAAPIQQEKVVVDGKLVTGQNPASAAGVGDAVAKLLK